MKYKLSLLMPFMLMISMQADAEFPTTQWGVHISNFTGVVSDSATGYKNITYPITVLSGPTEPNTYYSQYIYFTKKNHTNQAYYTGIQPYGNGMAKVIFSYFGDNGKVLDKGHCHQGADGGNGITCNKLMIPFKRGITYNFKIKLIDSDDSYNAWEGLVEDTSTKLTYKIGAWATPRSLAYPSGNSIGFIETYTGIKSCAEIPATAAYFGAPIASISGNEQDVVIGKIHGPYAVGVCKGKVDITNYHMNDGQFILHAAGTD